MNRHGLLGAVQTVAQAVQAANASTQNDYALTPATPKTACICRALDDIGTNPTCPDHPWWARDAIVLNLADHPDGPWAAAKKLFGGGA